MAKTSGQGKKANFTKEQVEILRTVMLGLKGEEETQAELGERLGGWKQQTVSRLENLNDATGLTYEFATDIAHHANYDSLDQLFHEKGVHKYPLRVRDSKGFVIRDTTIEKYRGANLRRAYAYARHSLDIPERIIAIAIEAEGGPNEHTSQLVWTQRFITAFAIAKAAEEKSAEKVAANPPTSTREATSTRGRKRA